MGIYLLRTTTEPSAPTKRKTRPAITCIRGRLVEFKERHWFLQWERNGKDPSLAGAAKAIRKRYGKEKTCSCDTCALRTDAILSALTWVVGEAEELE
jgi:hypothetical protein